MIDQVCLEPDQDDYGTGRCKNSYVGTLEISGAGVAASWQLYQLALVADGDPNC